MQRFVALALTLFVALFSTNALMAQEPQAPAESGTYIYTITVKQGNTDLGTMELKLWPDVAPKHVSFFDARVAEGYYNGTAFHRVIPGFMIQGGDPNSKDQPRETWGTGGYPEKVDAEFSDKPHKRGVLSAARTADPNSFGGQFFVCVADASWLDGQYTAFGEVVSGMEVADAIVNSPRDERDNPIEKIEMTITRKEAE